MMITAKSKEECIKALRFARGSPDFAFEVLMSGQPIPEPEGGADGGAEYGDEGGDDGGAGAA